MPTRVQVDTTVRFERERGVSEIAVARGIAHVTVSWSSGDCDQGRLELLQALADAGVSLFLMKLHPDGLSFAVRPDHTEGCLSVLQSVRGKRTVLRDLGLVSTYAGAMRDLSGVLARIYRALASVNVPVVQTGDAYNAVHCLVTGDTADLAAIALREEFHLKTPVHELEVAA